MVAESREAMVACLGNMWSMREDELRGWEKNV